MKFFLSIPMAVVVLAATIGCIEECPPLTVDEYTDAGEQYALSPGNAAEIPDSVRVWFRPQSPINPSTDIQLFRDGRTAIRAYSCGITNPVYTWTVDGRPIAEEGAVMTFGTCPPGVYTVSVRVSERDDSGVPLVVARSADTAEATMQVTVIDRPSTSGFRVASASSSPFQTSVQEYIPGPGQFIGDSRSGGMTGNETSTRQASDWAMDRLNRQLFVSLGGFGGYIVVGFDHSLTGEIAIRGNSFDSPQGGSNEPGIVWVSQDVNGNGLADDVWYEIPGSEYGAGTTRRDYFIEYRRPGGNSDVEWTDCDGRTGSVPRNPFHTQDSYYPRWIEGDSYVLYGSCLASKMYHDGINWHLPAYGSGYADNRGTDYDPDSMCNIFRIADAVDEAGRPASLEYVDFVKVVTAVNDAGPTLGEVSTEIFFIREK